MCGRPLGMPPKRVPIVSTGKCSKATAAVAPKVTTMAPGILLGELQAENHDCERKNGQAVAGQLKRVPRFAARAAMRWKKSPGT